MPRQKPLDTSHSPSKRLSTFGPGPRGRKFKVLGKWECKKGRPLRDDSGEITHYVQKCTVLATGKIVKIKTSADWKRKYNKEYRESRERFSAGNRYRAGFKPKSGSKLYEAGQKAMSRR